MGLADGAEPLLRVGERAALEEQLAHAQVELRQEIIHRQEPFDAVPLDAFRIEQDLGRRPLGVEPPECLFLLLDVRPDGDEAGSDGLNDAGIRIDLGFQPSASPSQWGRGEVQ